MVSNAKSVLKIHWFSEVRKVCVHGFPVRFALKNDMNICILIEGEFLLN